MAMTVQAGPIGVPLTGNVLDTFCGSFRSVRPPRGPAAGQAGEQTAPSLPRHTGENDGILRSGRAAALPPLTEPQVAAVARLAAHLDANDSQKPAA